MLFLSIIAEYDHKLRLYLARCCFAYRQAVCTCVRHQSQFWNIFPSAARCGIRVAFSSIAAFVAHFIGMSLFTKKLRSLRIILKCIKGYKYNKIAYGLR